MKINFDLIIDKAGGEFDEILEFAWNHPFRNSLKKCLKHLETMCTNRGDDIVVELYRSMKPMSINITFIHKYNGNVGTMGELSYSESLGWEIVTY